MVEFLYPSHCCIVIGVAAVDGDGITHEIRAHSIFHSRRPKTYIHCRCTSPVFLHPRSFPATHAGFATISLMSSTTAGSASVVRSPSWSPSPATILRSTRRMILPERVFGRSGTT
jgi:hypothetical protein